MTPAALSCACALLLGLGAAANAATLRARAWPLPVDAVAAQPNLDTDARGRVLLSWVEPTPTGHRLRYAHYDGTRFAAPRTAAEGARWFVNWADVPAVRSLDGEALAAFWLQKPAGPGQAYDLRLARSADGEHWGAARTVHDDGARAEHGFAALWRWPGRSLAIAWLDGRHGGGEAGHGAMSLHGAVFDAALKKTHEWELDARTCDCCQTAVAVAAPGPVLVYRDRSADETRDIVLTRWDGRRWTPPQAVHADGWHMPACPVNGPAVAARGDDVAVAWYTAVGDVPRVRLALSRDGGAHFAAPREVAQGEVAGRVDVLAHPDGGWWASWIGETAEGAQLWLARYDATLAETARAAVATLPKGRGTGFPHLAAAPRGVYAVWTDIRAGKPYLSGLEITLE